MPPVLDRRVAFDERSLQFPMRALLPRAVKRDAKLWTTPRPPLPLNQGEEGACLGFGFSAELACDPVRYPVSNDYAFEFYHAAREIDRAEGRVWESGASVLAGAKLAKKRGLIASYRWAFGVDDVITTLCGYGPVILGIPWMESMYSTRPGGLVEVSGPMVGGHCILAHGFLPSYKPTLNGADVGPVVVWTNSWGPSYGVNGVGYIRVPDLAALLADDGEACVATDVDPSIKPAPKPAAPWWSRLFRWGR